MSMNEEQEKLLKVAQQKHRDTDFEAAQKIYVRLFKETGETSFAARANDMKRLAEIRPEFRHLRLSGLLLQHLLDERDFQTVLDVGSGAGQHAEMLRRHGKTVTEVDYGTSHYFKDGQQDADAEILIGDFVTLSIEKLYDCVLASHVLEHQPNVGAFLKKLHAVTREGGVVGISVPPLKHQIVGGHLTLWNGGLLLYNMVLAGFDCRAAWLRKYAYNISLVVVKRSIEPQGLVYDSGDIGRIAEFLPEGFTEGFDGNISSIG